MRTVRAKLVAIVLACIAPAIVAAIFRAREAESDLLQQAEGRISNADDALLSELEEDQTCMRTAIALAARDAPFRAALARSDRAAVAETVQTLSTTYTDTIVIAADAQGRILAIDEPDRAPRSLGPDASPAFAALLRGEDVVGLQPVTLGKQAGYSLVVASPVKDGAAVVGILALLTPIDADYLEHIEKQIGSDLALKVNDQLVAFCSGHPDPDLESHGGGVLLKRVGDRLFALNTFRPERLQHPGQLVELTASQDVTALRNEIWRDLYLSLAWLGAILAVVLGAALWLAHRMGSAIRALSAAAAATRTGTYTEAPPVRTGDELERLATDFNQMVQGLRERDHLKDTFGRYVTRQVVEHLLQGNVELGGEMVPVTVLFSDIRSFTTISEMMHPKALLEFLNEYFSGMVESVMVHHGVVDKFIGDAIMAVFGAPVPRPDDALHAVKAALEMRTRLEKLNEGFRSRGLPEIRTGIGLHTGQVVAGNMGHVERMEYTVIGDTVNLASRLESLTKELQSDILMSEDTFNAVAEHVVAEPLQRIRVKGRVQEVLVYRLVSLKGEQSPALSDQRSA